MQRTIYRRLVSESNTDRSTLPPDNNPARLKRISQSFEDLTSESLYNKWKKARKNGEKIDENGRSNSLSSLFADEIIISRDTMKEWNNVSSFHKKSRTRGWTICNGQISRGKELQSPDKSSISYDVVSMSSSNDAEASPMTVVTSSENIFSVANSDFELKDQIESTLPIKNEIFHENSLLPSRGLSQSDQRINGQHSIKCRQTDDLLIFVEPRAQRLSCREAQEIEFLRIEEMAQREATSGEGSALHENIWQKRNSTGDLMAEGRHKRMPSLIHAGSRVNSSPWNIQETSFGFANDRSQQESNKRYNLGPTFALINKPQPQLINSTHEGFPNKFDAKDLNDNSIGSRIISDSMSKESRSIEDKEKDDRTVRFQQVEIVSEYSKDSQMSEGSLHGVRRSQTLPRMPKRPLVSLTTKNWKESEIKTRKAAEDLIHNINKSDEKSAQERVDVVEAAFEWIRKEVADLRAQDKDIMRMFTKIQAGIRTIKFDQSALMESEDEFISTPDLSTSPQTSYGGSIQRRASLR